MAVEILHILHEKSAACKAQDQVSIERFLLAAVYELQDRFFAQMAPNKISQVCDFKSIIEEGVFGVF